MAALDYRCVALGSLVPEEIRESVWDGGKLKVSTVPENFTRDFVKRKGTLDPWLYGPNLAFLRAKAGNGINRVSYLHPCLFVCLFVVLNPSFRPGKRFERQGRTVHHLQSWICGGSQEASGVPHLPPQTPDHTHQTG